jgi:hypothetical protein
MTAIVIPDRGDRRAALAALRASMNPLLFDLIINPEMQQRIGQR